LFCDTHRFQIPIRGRVPIRNDALSQLDDLNCAPYFLGDKWPSTHVYH
jgi:hypothetical protein